MKRKRNMLLILLSMAGVLLLLSGCSKETSSHPSPRNEPLDAETIKAALERSQLSGVLAESETYTDSQGLTHYVLENPSYSEERIDDILFVSDVSSFDYDGEKLLLAVFYQKLDSSVMNWKEWKPQLDFAAILFDRFENPEDVYQAFCEKELPAPPENNATYKWDAQLPEGYCVVNYMPYSYKRYDENGFEIRKHSAAFRVNIYESYELYQKIQARAEDVSTA